MRFPGMIPWKGAAPARTEDRSIRRSPRGGYLTHHLPCKVTRARISDSATEQVLTHETRGKKMQLYKSFLPKRLFVLFDYIDNGILKTTREHVSGKADQA